MEHLYSPAPPTPLARTARVGAVRPGPRGGGGGAVAPGALAEPPRVSRTAGRQLMVDALETPPRLRTDLDLAVLQQCLTSLDAFASVAPAAVHYLATECSITRVPDGEVLFYQEDPIDAEACAFVVIEGSLCGYYSKAFAQRTNVQLSFSSWNERQTNSQSLVVEFGELQTTYRKEDLCGFDDFFLAANASASAGPSRFCRRRGVHAQEYSILLTFAKDSLERAVHRFELQYHQGQLHSPKTTGKPNYSHIAPLGLLSSREYGSLLANASKERLDANSLLFSSRDNEASRGDTGIVIVLQGRLDIYLWSENEAPRDTRTVGAERDTRFPPILKEKPPAASEQGLFIASVRRGHSFGDQTVALGHCSFWSSSLGASLPPSRATMTVRVLVGEPGTEVIWISRVLYEGHLRNDRLRFSYVPLALLESSSAIAARVGTKVWEDMAFESSTKGLGAADSKRDAQQTSRLSRSLMADASLSSFFFQLPPLVIERLCACFSLLQFPASEQTRLIECGQAIHFVFIVIRGRLRLLRPPESPTTTANTSNRLSSEVSAFGPATNWYDQDNCVPGDAFGAMELLRGQTSAVYTAEAAADTLLLCIPQLIFRRWVKYSPSKLTLTPGSVLAKLATASSPTKLVRPEFRKLSALVGQRASYGQSPGGQVLHDLPALPDGVPTLLYRLGVLELLPRFLGSQLLPFAVLVRKRAGETLFQESDEKQALVAVVSGFVSIYSREHMTSAVEMMQNHPFCRVATFPGDHTNPDDYAATMSLDEDDEVGSSSDAPRGASAQHSPSKFHHRSATHGLHVHTLAPLSAFRTGVMHDGQICPGTVIAQTDCECIVIDEGVYNHVVAHHSPAIDITDASASLSSETTQADGDGVKESASTVPGPSGASCISKCMEASALPWLHLSAPKKQLAIRSMRQVVLTSGQQWISAGDHLNDLVVVVSGTLSVFVRQCQELASKLDARQQSMKSVTLEQTVTSNYSTTSQQLYSDDDEEEGGASSLTTGLRGAKQERTFAIRRQLSRLTRETKSSMSGIFVDSVLAAVEEEKFRRQSASLSKETPPRTGDLRGTQHVTPLLHSAIHRASISRKFSIQRTGRRRSQLTDHQGRHHRVAFLCHLSPGDTFGEDILEPSGACQRSKHDVFADAPIALAGGDHTNSAGRVDLLCLDRRVYQAILAKTDEEVESELRLRSALVRSKWKRAGKDATTSKRLQAGDAGATERDSGRTAQTATPRLLTLFQNLVNQRYHLTSRTIADIPLLRSLPEAAKREICLVAKFEAIDRRSDANALYRLDAGGRGSSSKPSETPFFIVLSGRVALVGSNTRFHSVASGTAAVGGVDSSHWLREVAVGGGFGEFDIFVPGATPCVLPVAIEATKMLSVPAPMFVKHWPLAQQMKETIEYLRSGVPMFADLSLDRLACLYEIVELRSFTREETVLDLTNLSSRASVADSMCLIKSGTCCIRRYLSLAAPVPVDNAERSPWTPPDSPTPATAREVRVKATIADVNAGHFFWIQADTHPFILEGVSAASTVAIFPIDRLRMILPRANLSRLDAQRIEMERLHQSQVQLAHQAMAALVSEKEAAASTAAKLAMRSNATHEASTHTELPAFTTRALPLVSPRAHSSGRAQHATGSLQEDVPIKTPRVLQSTSTGLSSPGTLPPFFGAEARHPSHRLEHYYPESEMLGLAGSFAGDESANSVDPPRLVGVAKQDEVSLAESTSPSAGGVNHVDRKDRAPRPAQLSFNVCIPRVPDDSAALSVTGLAAECRPRTPRAGTPKQPQCTPINPWRLIGGSFAASNGARIEVGLLPYTPQDGSEWSGESWTVLEVDLRARVAAKLSDVSSPLRTISLIPCKPGKRSISGLQFQVPAFFPDNRAEEIAQLFSPLAPHPALKGGTHRQRSAASKSLDGPPSVRVHTPELVRKQGFLVVADASFGANNARILLSGSRRFYVLVGRELREYPDTVVLQNLSRERWTASYTLSNALSKVVDVRSGAFPVFDLVRAQSFQLVVDGQTSLVFTAASQMERKQWMAALHEACCLASDSSQASPYPSIKPVRAPEEPKLTSTPRGRKKTAAIKASNNSAEEDAMPVEYCIS